MKQKYDIITLTCRGQDDSTLAQLERVADIVRRQIARRSGPYVVYFPTEERLPLQLELAIDPALRAEAFAIEAIAGHGIRITGGDRRGVLYGCGRFLRAASYQTGFFCPADFSTSCNDAPRRSVRGMYLASHRGNWYVHAPQDEVIRYMEELALWGFNAIGFWYCMADYQGPADPASRSAIKLFHNLTDAAHDLGLEVYVTLIANEPYKTTPQALRAQCEAANGYTRRPLAWFAEQICPSQPGGLELILDNRRQMLDLFADLAFDAFIIVPYDQGGCTCAGCAPWGSNGYLRTLPPVIELLRRHSSKAKIVVSAWEFDKFTTGEYAGLDRALRAGALGRVDAIMADNHFGQPVPYIAEHGVPGGLPLLGFPEISMWGIEPWGGYGAIANPRSLQAMWDRIKHLSRGGFPYSEGLFEDVNKIICAGFYWNDRPAQETLHEYTHYEFGPHVADDAVKLINLMEESFPRKIVGKRVPLAYKLEHPDLAERAWQQAEAINNRLSVPGRRAWRWRLIYLRCLIDRELCQADGHVNLACEEALNELTEIYHYGPQSNYCMDPQRIVRHGKVRSIAPVD